MALDWDDMRIFLAVARAETLSGAGRALRLDPATLHRRIARLERALASPLFVKSPQGYRLSAAGERLLPHAERAEQALMLGREALSGQAATLGGQLRIGAPDGCANFLLPQVCARIAAENPELELQILALARVVNLSRREADMAVAVSRPESGRLTAEKITDYHLHLAASRDYLAAHGPIRTPADLRGHRIVGYIPDMIFDKELDYLHEIGARQIALASNSVSVQVNLLRRGGGIGFVHAFAMPFAPELVPVLPGRVVLRRAFHLVRHRDDQQAERLNRMAALIGSGIRAEVARLEASLDSRGAER